MKEFLDFVVRQLIDAPDEMVLREETTVDHRSFFLFLPPAEVGKIIGKQGHTIRAIRSLLEGAARHGEQVSFEVEEHGASHP